MDFLRRARPGPLKKMELLIPGLILVALMIYASTRIKRSAARAFEAETIETDEFVIQKPEGFLNVIGGDPKFVFEAYSKDFGGGGGAENIRRATANIVVKDNSSIEIIATDILNSGGKFVDDRTDQIGGINYRVIEHIVTGENADLRVLSKLAERDARVFALTITVIREPNPEFMRNIEAMLDSFELK